MNNLLTVNERISKRGFTLIELLIVIAIIGILAATLLVSLGGARQAARDARRIADLRNMQAVLELYSNKCAGYPGDESCGNSNPTDWGELGTNLIDSELGVNSIPKDPIASRSYVYGTDATPTSLGQNYVLRASLERDNAALRDDVDGPLFGVDCDDASPDFYYCVRN